MHFITLPNLWLTFCWLNKIQKISHFWHFNDHNSRIKHDKQTNDPTFLSYFLGSICWYISCLHFKSFKIQFNRVPWLQYILVCKIQIYILNKTFSNLLNIFSFSMENLLAFGIWHVSLPIWYQFGPDPMDYKKNPLKQNKCTKITGKSPSSWKTVNEYEIV